MDNPKPQHVMRVESGILGSPMQSRSFGIVSFQEYKPALAISVRRSGTPLLVVKKSGIALPLRKSEKRMVCRNYEENVVDHCLDARSAFNEMNNRN